MVLIETHLWRYALYRAYLNLISEASRYYLGWLWWFLEPIAMTAVFFFVFTVLRAPNVENFQYFLIVGVTTWLWFNNGVANSTDSLMGAKSLISQMQLPKLLFPFTTVVSASLKHAFVFATVLIFMGTTLGPSMAWLYLPVLVLTQLVLILAVASTVAFVCCWIRDIRLVVRSGLTLMMFCSGHLLPDRQNAPRLPGRPPPQPDGHTDRRLPPSAPRGHATGRRSLGHHRQLQHPVPLPDEVDVPAVAT